MDLSIAGKTALVIAGSKGIGAGVVRSLVREGVRVAFTSRNPQDPHVEVGHLATGFTFDTDDLDAIGPLVTEVEAELGQIDILVLNTGGPASHDDPFDVTLREWHRAHRSLHLSPFETIRHVIPQMAERRWGRIVLVSSFAATQPLDRMPLSNAYRPSLIANFTVLSRLYGARGVTLNTVVPGIIGTGRSVIDRDAGDIDETVALSPLGRLGTSDEVGDVIAFLASERAAFMTGTQIPVDGGLTLHGRFGP